MSASLIRAAVRFCGAGGTSTGLAMACKAAGLDVELLAISRKPCVLRSSVSRRARWLRDRRLDEKRGNAYG